MQALLRPQLLSRPILSCSASRIKFNTSFRCIHLSQRHQQRLLRRNIFAAQSALMAAMCQAQHQKFFHSSQVQRDEAASKPILDDNFKICIMGVGNAGVNALMVMKNNGVFSGATRFVAVNTDAQSLQEAQSCDETILIGDYVSDPDAAADAAADNLEAIFNAVGDSKLLVLCAGLGGNTGTAATPVIAQEARARGITTVACVYLPFLFEGETKLSLADDGIAFLEESCDAVITLDNEPLDTIVPSDDTILLAEAFKKADDTMFHAVRGISDALVQTSSEDEQQQILELLRTGGRTYFALDYGVTDLELLAGTDETEQRRRQPGKELLQRAMAPVLEHVSNVRSSQQVLLNISGSEQSLTEQSIQDIQKAMKQEVLSQESSMYLRPTRDEQLLGGVKIAAFFTGIPSEERVFLSTYARLKQRDRLIKDNAEDITEVDKFDLLHGAQSGDVPEGDVELQHIKPTLMSRLSSLFTSKSSREQKLY